MAEQVCCESLEELIGELSQNGFREDELKGFTDILDIILNLMPFSVYIKNVKSEFLYGNSYVASLMGTEQNSLIGKTDFDFYRQKELAEKYFRDEQDRVFGQGKDFQHEEPVINQRTEEALTLSSIKVPLRKHDGRIVGLLGLGIDVTKKKIYEEEVQKMHKLEYLGKLAGGIAHDMNNLLAGIFGHIDLAKRFITDGDHTQAVDCLDTAQNGYERARELTARFLTFSKGGTPVKKTISIDDFVRQSVDFISTGSNVRVNYNFDGSIYPVDIDEGQMNQVINNIIINAQQAMEDGGTINIRIKNVSSGGREVPEIIKKGEYVKISIRDEGKGIPSENLPRIFDPGFTTKKEGNGIGLATCYSIVKRHEGYIFANSKIDKGTTMDIYLKASARKSKTAKPGRLERITEIAGGKILIMDDDAMVSESVKRILSQSGFECAAVESGEEALKAYKKAKEAGKPFDVVIMDLTIPGGMGGKDAIKELLRYDPHAKAIVYSGYSEDPVISDFSHYGFRAAMQKPFVFETLTSTIDQIVKS